MKLCKFCYELLCRRFNDVKRLNIGPVVNRNRNVSYSYYRQQSTSTNKSSGYKTKEIDLSKFPPEYIRNFSIIAHVDHGKSTLADRLLELTGTIPSDRKNEQVLDKLQVERERGITVKAQTASLFYKHNGETYLLNLVDTPGHVDFHYEVSRSLAACQGVILLIDANQGVQAQTVANMYMALESKLVIIPVLNKIDLKGAQPDVVTKQLQNLFPMEQNDILKISAKHGTGVEDVLKAVIERVPAPAADSSEPLKALLFDSWYDKFKGAVCNIAICDGVLRRGDRFVSSYTKLTYDVQDIGILFPDQTSTGVLYAGQVGYMIGNIKKSSEAKVGDTLYLHGKPVTPLPGFKPAKAMVFAGIYPPDQSQYNFFKEAITKLTLNDSSVDVHTDHSAALGQGWRLGFLGLLHMDVFQQRLEQEFNASVIVTAPNIPYKVKITGPKNIKKYGGEEITILNPCKLPDPSIISHYYEPIVMATIIFPEEYIGGIQQLVMERRGEQKDSTYIDDTRVLMKVQFPLNEILTDFFDELKSLTSGYASFDYEDAGYQESDLVKVTFLLNDKEIEDLTSVWHKGKARNMAKLVCSRLKDSIPRQLFKIVLLGRVGNQTIAREELQALKKDVTAKCYGGDITRKNKLLQKQMEGKKRMRQIGKVQVPKDAFISVLRK